MRFLLYPGRLTARDAAEIRQQRRHGEVAGRRRGRRRGFMRIEKDPFGLRVGIP